MAFNVSTDLANALLVTGSLKTVMENSAAGFFIDIYSGARPTNADTAPSGALLVTVYSNGTSAGCHFDTTATAATLNKAPAENWTGTCINTGVAGWFRMRIGTDNNGSNTTYPRLDGNIASSGAELNMSNLSLTSGAVFTLSAASFNLNQS